MRLSRLFRLSPLLLLAACQSAPAPGASGVKTPAQADLNFKKGESDVPVVRWVSKPSGLPATTVLISGSGFTGTSEVKINAQSVTYTVQNDNLITATVSADTLVDVVQVTSPNGSGELENIKQSPDKTRPNLDDIRKRITPVNISLNAPTISSLSASSGAIGSTVTITGSNFSGTTSVSFDGVQASFTVNSDSQITATVPGGANDGQISLSTGNGMASLVNTFDVTNKVWFVKADASGDKTGASWSAAYSDLQNAISSAAAGDEIWVAKGTYKPTSTSDKSISFALKANVKIYGGFAGTEKDLSARNWQSNATILSGDLNNNDDYTSNDQGDFNNSFHVVTGADNATLDGFSIRGGFASGSGSQNQGGGIYCASASPILSNLIISNNFSSSYGGGLYVQGGTPTLSNVVISKNFASYNGAGAHIQSGGVTFSNAVIADNTGASGGGNGINVELGTLTISNATFLNNHLRYAGNTAQGAYLYNLLLRNSTLTDAFSGVVEKQGVVTAAADPFTAVGDPDGADNLWLTSDDGLRISDFATVVNQGVTGNSVPSTDILGNSRINNPEPGAYESSQVQIP